MDTVKTKAGEFEVKQTGIGETSIPVASRPNKHKGEVEITNPRTQTKIRMNAAFQAAIEIEEQLGSLDGLRFRAASGGMPGIPGLTTRDYGTIIAAGAKAAGDAGANAQAATEFAYGAGRDAIRQPTLDFLYMLTHGGQARVDDLGNGGSPSASLGDSSEKEASELITEMASRSDGYLG